MKKSIGAQIAKGLEISMNAIGVALCLWAVGAVFGIVEWLVIYVGMKVDGAFLLSLIIAGVLNLLYACIVFPHLYQIGKELRKNV